MNLGSNNETKPESLSNLEKRFHDAPQNSLPKDPKYATLMQLVQKQQQQIAELVQMKSSQAVCHKDGTMTAASRHVKPPWPLFDI